MTELLIIMSEISNVKWGTFHLDSKPRLTLGPVGKPPGLGSLSPKPSLFRCHFVLFNLF